MYKFGDIFGDCLRWIEWFTVKGYMWIIVKMGFGFDS